MRYMLHRRLQFGNYPFLLLDIFLSPEQLIFETSNLLKGACFLVIHPSLFFGDIKLELSDFLLLRLIELAYLGLEVSDAAALAEDLKFSLSVDVSQLFLHSTVLPRKLNDLCENLLLLHQSFFLLGQLLLQISGLLLERKVLVLLGH